MTILQVQKKEFVLYFMWLFSSLALVKSCECA